MGHFQPLSIQPDERLVTAMSGRWSEQFSARCAVKVSDVCHGISVARPAKEPRFRLQWI